MYLPFSSRSRYGRPYRVGVSGTGFLGRGLIRALQNSPEFSVTQVMSRRPAHAVEGVDRDLLTDSPQALAEDADMVIECSGDVSRGAEVVQAAHQAGLPVVTMGSEFHVTVGSWFCETGLLSEAEGDQPGSLVAFAEDAAAMGFEPLVYGNIKGFLNHDPEPDEMAMWSQRNGISLQQVTSFTDGTKLQIEQALVANGAGATVLQKGLLGLTDQLLDTAGPELAAQAQAIQSPVVDYVLNRNLPPGVFVTATHAFEKPEVLRYLKFGEGPFYTLVKPFHLCHLEMIKTIRRLRDGGGVLLNNSARPRINVCAIAKRDFKPGEVFGKAIGGFELRGEAVPFDAEPSAVPLGLLDGARVLRRLERSQTLRWEDVEIPEGIALTAAIGIRERLKQRAPFQVREVNRFTTGIPS